ncbi:MAG: metallophosphoesterase [Deltaproteobacteria bacterium]|nr:metallophosphoesterase [Deltaproteobacteria bacterium]
MKRFILFLLSFYSLTVAYADGIPAYLADGSNVIWFLQITDTHVDSNALKYYKDYFPWVLNEAVPLINPSFVVVTGDLTDSTKSTIPYYGSGPHEEEWLKYREIYTNAMMTPSFYYDCPGNHDAYGDGQLAYYLKYSMQGSFTKSTQSSWYVDNGKGIYHFFYAATTANDGKQWPSDNQELTDDELIQIDRFLKENPDASMRIAFAHHDYEKENVKNKDRFLILLKQYGVSYFGHGHEHDTGFRIGDGKIIKYRMDSLGQSEGNNVAIWAIDNYSVTIKTFKAMSVFPAAVITAPADVILDDPGNKIENPYIPPVSVHCSRAPARALVFSKAENPDVTFRIDNGKDLPMFKRKKNPSQYRGYFDATSLSTGIHTITVKVKSDITNETKNEFYVSDIPCEIGEEDSDEVVLSDAGSDYNAEGLSDERINDYGLTDSMSEESSDMGDYTNGEEDIFSYEDSLIPDIADIVINDTSSGNDIYLSDIVIIRPDMNGDNSDSESSGCSCNVVN